MNNSTTNLLTKIMTRMAAAIAIVATFTIGPLSSFAQSSSPATSIQNSASSGDATSSGFQSEGIKATITSISLLDRKIIIQFLIQNKRENDVYLALIGGYGGSAGTLMATNGAVYLMSDPGHTVSGMSSCYPPGSATTTDDNVNDCLKGFDEHNMTKVESGQTAILGIIYGEDDGKAAEQKDNINFALKFLVRSAPGQGDMLSEEAAGKPGPPSIVTISFPLVPVAGP